MPVRAPASFSLEQEYKDLLQVIANRTRRSMTAEVRYLIDARAIELGLDPVQELVFDPPPEPAAGGVGAR